MSRKVKYVIYKITDDLKQIVVEEQSEEEDYEIFREKLASAKDAKGNPAPRYATYDVEYDLGGGEGKRYVPPIYLSSTEREPPPLIPLETTEARSSSSPGFPKTPPLVYVQIPWN